MNPHRDMTLTPRPTPKGLAFEIADLVLVSSWADRHDFRMVIRLDHGASVNEDFEEAIALETKTSPVYRLILWRTTDAIFVQPLVGKGRRYKSVATVLESLVPIQETTVTNITATEWPPHRI